MDPFERFIEEVMADLVIPDGMVPEFDPAYYNRRVRDRQAFELSGLDRRTLYAIEAAACSEAAGYPLVAEQWRESAGYGGLG